MRALTLSLIGIFLYSVTSDAAAELDTSTLVPRSGVCANAPHTVAGTTLDRRTRPLDNLAPRSPALPGPGPGVGLNAVLWCAPHTRTYLVVTVTSSRIASNVILNLINDAYVNVMGHLSFHGDSVIIDGNFFWAGESGVNIHTFNAGNHQQTWGVLGAALSALRDFMFRIGTEAGACYFTIIDGNNIVGRGAIV